MKNRFSRRNLWHDGSPKFWEYHKPTQIRKGIDFSMINKKLELWYDTPASLWEECIPVGNGSLGSMIYGGVFQEKLQINEESVWYGKKTDRNNPDALKNLKKIRDYIENDEFEKAERLSKLALTGVPDSQRTYQTLGDIILGFHASGKKYSNYKRSLNLTNATSHICYEIDSVIYTRDIFCSHPDNVLVMKLSCSKEKSLSFDCMLTRSDYLKDPAAQTSGNFCLYGKSKYFSEIKKLSKNQLMLTGDCSKDAIEFCSSVRVESVDGIVETIGSTITVREATQAVLYFSASTSFKEENHLQICTQTLESAANSNYYLLYNRHLIDYRTLFNKSSLELESNNNEAFCELPTDKRLENFDSENDMGFINLYFAFCRYLMISCSRRGGLPANLQGIWCNDFDSEWDSKYTININTQMNYWPALTANLAQCHYPLLDFMKRLNENGRITAQKMYGCKGAVAHHNSDIWADTAPQDMVTASTYWCFGMAWLSLHIWEHFQFTQDTDFLKEYYYILKDSAIFFLDWLYEDESGVICSSPSTSPENVFVLPDKCAFAISKSCSMDFQILSELFEACEKANNILKEDFVFIERLKLCAKKFPPYKIGSKGQILEWEKEYDEIDKGHRHFSLLFSLFPGKSFDIDASSSLAVAAKRTIELRIENGSAHTGWSRAWVINLYARLKDGEQSYLHLCRLFELSTIKNLFNSHPPFQIDGNFGALSGICEMLLQSHNQIELLPALPKQFKNGKVCGLVARGNITVDIYIKENELDYAFLFSPRDKTIVVKYKGREYNVKLNAGCRFKFIA